MSRSVIATDLNEVLTGVGPFTVFAPSDLAFGKVESSAFASLFKPENKVMLTDLLNHHIVRGKYEFKDLKEGTTLETLDGKELTIEVDAGFTRLDGATIQNRDVPSANGVIHSLDRILKN
ncbi:MAG TPA: fasciclin domain-containing protein [Chitinophagaceae bacterium]|nr:fasciclin domain-containing protein [Chitinophagaceae bacterium]